ncbi:ATP-binding protein [Tenacibaculum finnmarkense]|uniref:ATP-binding protein n=1 Tax=Tenacibaculum finnmarkense TaxID=2781243 RepID=UPI001E5B6D35|nr:ATP-binding protein [Tenacibaculum finnmarkense]MCD8411490.1 putative DNA binding domain-containing protein [Tenacibaculum finnmarkense genomovar ulcerans]
MEENSQFDKKSLKLIKGSTADWKELAKDCVCFANGVGGEIHIGIEDEEDFPDATQKIKPRLIDEINKRIPQLTLNVGIIPSIEKAENGGEYINLKILRSSQTIACTSNGKYYMRVADECRPLMPEDMTRVASEKQAFVWEEKVVRKISIENVDFSKRDRLLSDIINSERVSNFVREMSREELLDYYLLTSKNYVTNLGLLWFGTRKDRALLHYAPTIQFIKYDEQGNKINKILWDDFTKNPKELLNEIIGLPDWKESVEISDGLFRKTIPNYDIEVIREIIANALVHKVYTMRGDIFINLYHDRLEIHSPGRLPLGITPSNILSKSVQRNQHLSKIFHDLKLIEKEGSGYDKIFEIQLFNGKSEPLVEEWDDRVIVTLKKQIISKEVVRLMSRVNDEFNLNQKQIIALGLIAQSGAISAIRLSKKLCVRTNDSLKYWIEKLLKNDIILSKGRTKAREYSVNPELLKNIDFKGVTDLKKIESHRLEHLILEDLKIYQPCSKSDIHTRIGLEIHEKKLKRSIDKLVKEGEIQQIGENRWRKYRLL